MEGHLGFMQRTFDIKKYDPMQKRMDDKTIPRMDPWKHGVYYTAMTKAWEDGWIGSSSETRKDELRRSLSLTFGNRADDLWGALLEKGSRTGNILDNPAFVEFMLNFGAKSKVFLPWILEAPHAFNLMAAFGMDTNGERIPIDDEFFFWLIRGPLHISIRFRICMAKELLKGKDNATILAIGSGMELRLLEQEDPGLLPKGIIACDSDPRVSERCREYAETSSNMGSRLDYREESLLSTLMSLPAESQDVITATGIGSYCVEQLPDLMPLAVSKLKPDGTLMMDLQIREWSLDHNTKLTGWEAPSFKPSRDVEDATATMEIATRGLPLSVRACYVDPRIRHPIGVVFVLKR